MVITIPIQTLHYWKPMKGKSLKITIDLHHVWSPQQNKTPKQMIPSNQPSNDSHPSQPHPTDSNSHHRDTNLAASSTTEQFTNASTIHPKVTEDGWMPFSCINFQVDLVWKKMLQGINISHLGKGKIIFKVPFLGDMSVSWRVTKRSKGIIWRWMGF